MQVIYVTEEPRGLDFAVVDRPEAVPAGATILAICDGARYVPQLDEHFFAAITDEEYYTYMALVREVVNGEKKEADDSHTVSAARRFVNWLSDVVAEDGTLHGSSR